MKVGDLVKVQRCAREGMMGIIVHTHEQTTHSLNNPKLRLYQVILETGEACFTGNQLARI